MEETVKIEIEISDETLYEIICSELRAIIETDPKKLWDEPEYVESLKKAAAVMWTWYSCPGDEVPSYTGEDSDE